jgi:hypothetical protein
MLIQINTESLTQEQKELLKQGGWMKKCKTTWYEPERYEEYFYLDDFGVGSSCGATPITKRVIVFRTRAEAEKADAKRIALTSIQRYIAQNGMEFVVDWNDTYQEKWVILVDRMGEFDERNSRAD